MVRRKLGPNPNRRQALGMLASGAISSGVVAETCSARPSNLGNATSLAGDEFAAILPSIHAVQERSALASLDPVSYPLVYLAEPGREGVFRWTATDQSSRVEHDPRNGCCVAPANFPDGLRGAWLRVFEGNIFPQWFGRIGSDVDSSLAINAAIAFAQGEFESIGAFGTIQFPPGKFAIASAIQRTGSGNYVDLIGAGQRNTIIIATNEMKSMLDLSNPGDVAGRTTISGITFDCNRLARCAVDAKEMRYWTLRAVEILRARSHGVVFGNWVTRLENIVVRDCPVGLLIDGIENSPTAANNLVVTKTSISNCKIGIHVEDRANDISFENCALDLCANAGVYLPRGARSCKFADCYFERCGKTLEGSDGAGVEVAIGEGIKRLVSGAIVASHDPEAANHSTFSGSIRNSFFANCSSQRLIALSNVEDFVSYGNKIHDGYTSKAFVEVIGEGCSTRCRRFEFEEAFSAETIALPVLLGGRDPEENHMNMRIANQDKAGAETRTTGLYWNDVLTEAGGSPVWDREGVEEFTQGSLDGRLVTRFSRGAVARLRIDLQRSQQLRGRYLRIYGTSRGVDGAIGGVYLRLAIDGADRLRLRYPSVQFQDFGRGTVAYVPKDASEVIVILRTIGDAPAEMQQFCVCDAAWPLDRVPTL